jgi:hypothetical protein
MNCEKLPHKDNEEEWKDYSGKMMWQKKRTRLMLWDWREMVYQDKLPHKQYKMAWFEGVVTTCDATMLLQVMMQIKKKTIIHFIDVNWQW